MKIATNSEKIFYKPNNFYKIKKTSPIIKDQFFQTNAPDVFNSYGKAFVNLSFKAAAKTPQKTIPEKDIQDIFSKLQFKEEDIDLYLSSDEECRKMQLTLAKKLEESGVKNSKIKYILKSVSSKNPIISCNQITLARKIFEKDTDRNQTADILYYTFSEDKENNRNQTTFANELLERNIDIKYISDILGKTKTNDKQIQTAQISFAKELLDLNFSGRGVELFLSTTMSDDIKIQENQSNFARELIGKNTKPSSAINVLSKTKSADSVINTAKIETARTLIEKGISFDDIEGILTEMKTYNRKINTKEVELVHCGLKHGAFGHAIEQILANTKSEDNEIQLNQIEFAKELFEKGVWCEDISGILRGTNSSTKEVHLRQISFAKELFAKGVSVQNIQSILSTTKTNSKEAQEKQIDFTWELLPNCAPNGSYKLWRILSATKSDDLKAQNQQIEFVRELINKGVEYSTISDVLGETKSDKDEIRLNQIEFARELLMRKSDNKQIGNILYGTNSENKKIQQNQIELAKKLIKNGVCDKDIGEILHEIKYNNEETNAILANFADELIFNGVDAKSVSSILDAVNTYSPTILSANISFAKALLVQGGNGETIAEILSATKDDDIDENLRKINQAQNLLREVKSHEMAVNQIAAIIDDTNKITCNDIKKLNRKLGIHKATELNTSDTIIACKLLGLCNVTDINQIQLKDKKNIIRKLVDCNSGTFSASLQLKKYFPLIPTTKQEYCTLLPTLVKSLGIATKELAPNDIQQFNQTAKTLGTALANLSDSDFNSLQLSQEYSKENFIKDTFEITKNLSTQERQKVFDYFGFELYKNKNGTQADNNHHHKFSILGYPVNLNNGKKLTSIDDENTRKVVEQLRPFVIKYSENNKIFVSNSPQITESLNEIVKYLPEFRTAIGKIQHSTHNFDVAKHSLKVLQKIVQNPDYDTLNDSDKKIMLLAALLHDIAKAEGTRDSLHYVNSSFDSYYITKKFNLTRDEELKLYALINNHEWLGYVNKKDISENETIKRQQSAAFDLQYDNLFDMEKIFTLADLKSVKNNNGFYEKFKSDFEKHCSAVQENIKELKKTQPLLPVTKVPSATRINEAITQVNADGSTNLKGIYKTEDRLIVIRFNEVENETWHKIGFGKDVVSRGIKTLTSIYDEVDTGNIHFFVHGLDYENQLSKFDAFNLVDSDAMLSVSYAERPESKMRFFRKQGVILNADTKYVYGGGNTDSGSGCCKSINDFKRNYVFDGFRQSDRNYISQLIKSELGLTDEEYLEFLQENKNKAFDEIEPIEVRNKLIKAFAGINSNVRNGNRSYNEMYLSNPEVVGVFAYPENTNSIIGNTMDFVNNQEDFLKKYAIERDIPMFVFGN